MRGKSYDCNFKSVKYWFAHIKLSLNFFNLVFPCWPIINEDSMITKINSVDFQLCYSCRTCTLHKCIYNFGMDLVRVVSFLRSHLWKLDLVCSCVSIYCLYVPTLEKGIESVWAYKDIVCTGLNGCSLFISVNDSINR
jgi:cellulose synthase/poly-beta-1,6-N-acetylglucosamine synthase-like glycosyltransferase